MADKKTLELQIVVAAEAAAKQVKSLAVDFKTLASNVKNIDGKAISQTVSRLQGEITRAANSVKLFGSSSAELRSVQQRVKAAALDLIDNGINPEADAIADLVREYNRLGDAADKLDAENKELSGGFSELLSNLQSLAPVAAGAAFDSQLGNMAGFALEQSDNFRAMREEFGIMLGDMEAGRGLFNELQEFNFWTPFDMDDTSRATKVLMAAKVPLAEITDYLTIFGDISQGNSDKFQSFISGFSKASAKGAVDMEVLNIYLDQGIQILDELGKQFGVASGEVINMASSGKISFADFDRALKSLAAEGGLYYGSMATASQRLEGAQAGLEESVNALAASFGDMLAPAVSTALGVLTSLVDAINNSPILKGALAGIITAIAVAINVQLVKAVVSLAAKMWASYAATMAQAGAMSILNPALLAGVAAAGLATAAVVAFAAKQQEAADAAADTTLELKKQKQSFSDLKNAAREYLSYMNDMTSDEAANIVASYSTIVIPAAEEALKKAKEKLAGITPTITEERRIGSSYLSGGGEETYTVEIANPDYEKAAEAVQKAEAELALYQARLESAREIAGEIEEAEFAADLADANAILERRNELYKNTAEYQREEIQANLDFARSLLTLQTLNEDGSYSGFDRAKTEAIIRDLEAQLADLDGKAAETAEKAAEAIGDSWSRKILSEVERTKLEFADAAEALAETAQTYYGDTYSAQADYIRENAALEKYYRDQIAALERQEVINLHTERMDAIREENEYRLALARERLNHGDVSALGAYTAETAVQTAQDTELGSVIQDFRQGGILGTIASVISVFIELFAQIENVNKLLNIVSTLLQPVIEAIEPIVNSILDPLVSIIEEIGYTLGMVIAPAFNVLQVAMAPVNAALNMLSPVLTAVAKVFEWLNNYVIVPVGNAFITVINAIIDVINLIPFVDIKKLDKLTVIGEKAEEISEEMEKQAELLKQRFERQKEEVESLLESQLDSVRSQYELGLISRADYEAQAEKYASEADEKLYDINKQQADTLAQIENNTYNLLSDAGKQAVSEQRQSYAEKWGDTVPVLGHIAGTVADVAVSAWEGIKSGVSWVGEKISEGWNKFTSWLGFDVGTPNIPYDMPAIVHKGETIIPRTFAEGIRSGELALVGGKSGMTASESGPVVVNITVAGSVVAENELTDVVYKGIARGMKARKYAPLPA